MSIKKYRIIFSLCGVCLAVSACKATTTVTEEHKKTYEELLDSIDMSADTLTVDLSDTVRIDAQITPESKYKNGLGIYEFEYNKLDLDTNLLLDKWNQYYGKEELTLQDNFEYILQITPEDEDLPKCKLYYSDSSNSFRYSPIYNLSDGYLDFARILFSSKYPLYSEKPELIAEQQKKLVQLFGGQFQNVNENDFKYISITDQKDYENMEQIFKKINLRVDGSYNEKGTDRIFQMFLETAQHVGVEKELFYALEYCEMIGTEEKLPLVQSRGPSYINRGQKELPDTSVEHYQQQVFTNADNYMYAVFDKNGELAVFYLSKSVKVNEQPEKTEKIIDIKQAADIAYKKFKDSKAQIVIYSMELCYMGVIFEEGEELEDYICPVWRINYYDSSTQSNLTVCINAVTGKELGE